MESESDSENASSSGSERSDENSENAETSSEEETEFQKQKSTRTTFTRMEDVNFLDELDADARKQYLEVARLLPKHVDWSDYIFYLDPRKHGSLYNMLINLQSWEKQHALNERNVRFMLESWKYIRLRPKLQDLIERFTGMWVVSRHEQSHRTSFAQLRNSVPRRRRTSARLAHVSYGPAFAHFTTRFVHCAVCF